MIASLKGRGLVEGNVKGQMIISSQPLSFLGGVDRLTGKIVDPKSDLYQEKLFNKILYIPRSVGSTVGAYVIYAICKNNLGPKAIICDKADSIVVTGCAIAGIPLIDGIKYEKLSSHRAYAVINGTEGIIKIFDNKNDLY